MSRDLSLLRGYALCLVREHIASRKSASIVPAYAMMPEMLAELREDFTQTLRELCREGMLTVTTDINKNPMFGLVQKQDKEI